MRALVTGGAGYIGSQTCKALARAGNDVLVYDNLSTGHRRLARWGEFEHGDIQDTQKLRDSLKKWRPDVLIHFAASSQVGESVQNPGKYFRNNVAGTLSILEAMRDEGIENIVVSGSAAVYGQPAETPLTERTKAAPINPYGASKLFMERMLADFAAAHGIKWMSLRYFNAAGCDPEGETGELHTPETHLVPRIIMAALGIIPQINIFGDDYPTPDGTCIRDYIHVADLAEAHIRAASHLLDNGESMALNLGTGAGASVREILQKLEEITAVPIPYGVAPRREGDPATLLADASLARSILGWKAERDIDAILRDAWNFMKENRAFLQDKLQNR